MGENKFIPPDLSLGRLAIRPIDPNAHAKADRMYDRVATAIREFEESLDGKEEVGAQLAQFGQSVTVAIEDIGYYNPYLFVIYGVTAEGHRCQLLQHVTQVNILLVALKAKGEPRRIGFKLTPKDAEGTDK